MNPSSIRSSLVSRRRALVLAASAPALAAANGTRWPFVRNAAGRV